MFKQSDPSVSLFDQWTARWQTKNAPYDWKWPSRYMLATCMIGGAWMFYMWLSQTRDDFLILGAAAVFALWGLIVAKEIGLLLLALAGLALLWYWAKDFSKDTWRIVGIGAFVGYGIYHLERGNKRLQVQIDQIKQELYTLRK